MLIGNCNLRLRQLVIITQEESRVLKDELEASRANIEVLSADNAKLAAEVTRLKTEAEKVQTIHLAEVADLKANSVHSQGPLL